MSSEQFILNIKNMINDPDFYRSKSSTIGLTDIEKENFYLSSLIRIEGKGIFNHKKKSWLCGKIKYIPSEEWCKEYRNF